MSQPVAVSLFSGIGGFEAGFESAGISTTLMCEKDPSAQAVLRKNYPDIELVGDIADLTTLPDCSILIGGWPCQDLSQAGRMAGLNGPQSSLVSHIFRLIDAGARKPPIVLLENVAFALRLNKGDAIRYVTDALASRGYNWAYRILDTQNFGLPHRRRRIFICGMLDGDPAGALLSGLKDERQVSERPPNDIGFYWTEGNRGVGWTTDAIPPLKGGSGLHIPSPPAIWNIETGAITTPGIVDAERLQGFEPDWTAAASNKVRGDRERWRLVGNAVSVPVAHWLGERLFAPSARPASYDDGAESAAKHIAAYGGPSRPTRYLDGTGEGPAVSKRVSVGKFGIQRPSPLSQRAAEGFLRRYMRSGLTKDAQFARALADHCGLKSVP